MQNSFDSKNKLSKILIMSSVVVVVLALASVIVLLIFTNRTKSGLPAQTSQVETDKTTLQKILWFNLDIKESASKPFELKSIQSYSGRKPKSETAILPYRFKITNERKILFETSFTVPVIVSERVDRKTGKYTDISTPSAKMVVIRTPWFKDGTKFTVLDKNSVKILEGVIKDVTPGPKK